ncbi:MAG: ankyrin repeat domain-containing protein [Lautropia sp.]
MTSTPAAPNDSGTEARVMDWLRLAYAGEVTGGSQHARPEAAAEQLAGSPELARAPAVGWACGDAAVLAPAIAAAPVGADQPDGPLRLPPLAAVTHSSLIRLPEYADRLRECARRLLAAGADPNARFGNRLAPASLAEPAAEQPLSALYGAAGAHQDAAMTRLLLEAGADPNDGESLYHALGSAECTRLLLAAGARIAGTNAIYRALDLDDPEPLSLLLAHGGDPNEPAPGEPTSRFGSPLAWAIRRRCSLRHVDALLAAGADPRSATPDGVALDRLALRYGLPAIAARLRAAGAGSAAADDTPCDRFVAACAVGDEAAARAILAANPGVRAQLGEAEWQLLPELAAAGARSAVETMVRLGWPIAARGGDWQASALNHAVFRGDATLARWLLGHGAQWTELHGFGDNACGTLAWASCNQPIAGGDWIGCAAALLASGMPRGRVDDHQPDVLTIAGQARRFAPPVAELLRER